LVLTKGAVASAASISSKGFDVKVNDKGLVACRILKSGAGYNEGEIVGFTPPIAEAMIKAKVAELVKTAGRPPKQPAADTE